MQLIYNIPGIILPCIYLKKYKHFSNVYKQHYKTLSHVILKSLVVTPNIVKIRVFKNIFKHSELMRKTSH